MSARGRPAGAARAAPGPDVVDAARAFMVAVAVAAVVVALAAPFPAGAAAQSAPRERAGPAERTVDPCGREEFNTEYSGRFTFVRLVVRGLGRGGFGRRGCNFPWAHDYPDAERNFGRILDELTSMTPYLEGGNVLAMDDPELFRYPVAYLSEPGFWTMTDSEEESLREYLLKGGFLIIDDNRGPREWYNTVRMLERLLPDHRLIELDETHPIFDSFFHIEQIHMPHPNFAYVASYYGMFEDNDPAGRMLVIVNRDNDIGDYWEWSDRRWVPIELSNEAYKLGVNYVVYALTH